MNIQISSPIANRLIELFGTRLSIPVIPLPGEGLADLVFRAFAINGGAPPGWRAINHSTGAQRINLGELSDLLGTPNGPSNIYPISYPQVFRSISPGNVHVNFFGSLLPSSMLMKPRRVAPRSLTKALYSKALWHIRPLCFDVHSHERLLGHCPVCLCRLDFEYSGGVHRCRRCGPGVDLREFPQVVEDFRDIEAIGFLAGLIDPENPPGKHHPKLHASLASENTGDLFSLCVKIAELITIRESEVAISWKAFDIPPNNLEIAARAVLSWPDGVVEVMETIEGGVSPRTRTGKASQGKLLGRTTRLVSPTLHRLLYDVHQTYKFRVGSYITTSRPSFGSSDLLEITRTTKLYQHACLDTGLSPLVFWGCFRSGFFGETEDINIAGEAFRDWVKRLNTQNLKLSAAPGQMALTDFVKASFQGNGDPWPFVLEAILEQKLPVARATDASTRISDLQVADFVPWVEFLSQLKGVIHGDLVLRLADAAFSLNLRYRMHLARIFARRFTFNDLQVFNRSFVKTKELSDRLVLRGEHLTLQAVAARLDKAGIFSQHQSPCKSASWRSRSKAEQYFDL